ncbi:MAG TPA: transglutaminase domain-containing protein, partial [Flavobacteriaceae bacterium]|nr:transglutaminase domain-containing protein [Flavobacteriaceae bacterium]
NDQSIFHSDYRVKYTNIIFPLLGANYKIETEKKFNEIKYFTSEYFSGMFRTLNGKIIVHVPKWLDLEIHEFNFGPESSGDISKEIINNEDGKTITYTFSNIKGQSQKSNTPGRSHIYPHLVFVAKSFTRNGKTVALFNDVGDLYAWYNKLVQDVAVDPSVFSEKVAELTASAKTDIEKIKNIYYWVQDNIRYIAFEDGIAGFRPESPQQVYKKRYGDCKGMAFLTKAMLQEAGFDARLVWIGTDRLAYDYSVPSLVVNNHMICAVKLNGSFIFLDATEKYNQFGTYATRIQGKEGLVQSKEGYKILAVPSSKKISNIDSTHYSFSIEKDLLKGNANRYFSGECRSGFQNAYTSFGNKDRTEALSGYLTSGNNNFLVKEILPFDPENREKPLTISYGLEVANAIVEFDGTIYIDIDPVKNAGEMLFEERKAAFKFHIKKQKVTQINLFVPEGYSVGSLPEDFHLESELVDFSLDYELSEGKISYKKELKLKKRLIQPADFELWNQAFSTIKEKINRQITLVKNQS